MLSCRVITEKDEYGVLIAHVSDLPGCATEVKTREELRKNVREAVQACLEALKECGRAGLSLNYPLKMRLPIWQKLNR